MGLLGSIGEVTVQPPRTGETGDWARGGVTKHGAVNRVEIVGRCWNGRRGQSRGQHGVVVVHVLLMTLISQLPEYKVTARRAFRIPATKAATRGMVGGMTGGLARY